MDPTYQAIKEAIAPILSEIQLLRETVHSNYENLHTDYARLEDTITKKSSDISKNLTRKINENSDRITSVVAEN